MATECELITGFTLDCNEGVGGVKEIFIANWAPFATGINFDALDQITTLPEAQVMRYQPNRNTGALTITPTSNLENGTLYYVHQVELTLGKLDPVKRRELENLSKAKVIVFVRLYDDQILCIGLTDGAFLTAGTYQSGKTKGDLNGYQITLVAEEPNQPHFLIPLGVGELPFSNFIDIDVVPPYPTA